MNIIKNINKFIQYWLRAEEAHREYARIYKIQKRNKRLLKDSLKDKP